MDALLKKHPSLKRTKHGKIRCELTGHEMPARLPEVERYLTGKRYLQASTSTGRFKAGNKADKDFDPASDPQYGFFKVHKSDPGKLWCLLTKATIARSKEVADAHIAGRKFKNALKRVEEDAGSSADGASEEGGESEASGAISIGDSDAEGDGQDGDDESDESEGGESEDEESESEEPERAPAAASKAPSAFGKLLAGAQERLDAQMEEIEQDNHSDGSMGEEDPEEEVDGESDLDEFDDDDLSDDVSEGEESEEEDSDSNVEFDDDEDSDDEGAAQDLAAAMRGLGRPAKRQRR